MELLSNVMEGLGNTPLVALSRFCPGEACLAAKVEWFNPGSSVKDRIAPALIEAGERSGKLRPGGNPAKYSRGGGGQCPRNVRLPLRGVALISVGITFGGQA